MMMIIRRFVLLAALVPISLGWGSSAEPPVDVSIINLIATPEKFDGKLVSVIGFIHIGREQDLLFLGKQTLTMVFTKMQCGSTSQNRWAPTGKS